MLQNLVNETASKYDGVLKELAALLIPHIMAHPEMVKALVFDPALIEDVVQAKMDNLGPIDKATIREVCEEVIDAQDIDDKINDWMQSNWDIADYQSEVVDMVEDRIDDQVETYLQSHLEGQIESHVRNLTFTVEVS
jgi:hypothetical protein